MDVENSLTDKLTRLFGIPATLNRMSPEAPEQDKIFVEIQRSISSVSAGVENHKVEGTAFVLARREKLPFGFFHKAIQASPELAAPFFFFDVDASEPAYVDIVRRSFNFVFFYSSQYNPPAGSITEVTFKGDLGE